MSTAICTTAPAVEIKQVPRDQHTSGIHIALIFFVGLIARIPFYLAYRPIWSGDSSSYVMFYQFLTQHLFYLGWRTPVYPFFLGFAMRVGTITSPADPSTPFAYIVICLQSLFCILAAAFLYHTLRLLNVSKGIALAVSLIIVTMPALSIHEMSLLNMSLAFSLLMLVMGLFVITIKRLEVSRPATIPALATGIASSILIMNRPDLIIFVLLLLMMTAAVSLRLWFGLRIQLSSSILKATSLIALPAACTLLGWMLLMYIGIGQFRITTLDGWNRTRTVYNMFDRVDPADQLIGGIMSRTYNREVSSHAKVNLREIIWPALDELIINYPDYPGPKTAIDPTFLDHVGIASGRRALGWVRIPCTQENYCWQNMRKEIDVGDYLGQVSWKLARKYPKDYLRNLAVNFFEESFDFRFTNAKPAVAEYQDLSVVGGESVKSKAGVHMIAQAITAEAPLLTIAYVVTLGFFMVAPILLFRKPSEHWVSDIAIASMAVASVGTIVGTTVLAGFNRVYSLPHIAVFAICTAYAWENRARFLDAIPLRRQ